MTAGAFEPDAELGHRPHRREGCLRYFNKWDGLVGASKKLRRPVKWVATRSEADDDGSHRRDLVSYGELALDEKGKILAIRSQSLFQMGAYFVGPGMVSGLFSMRFIPEAYDVQAIHVMCKAPTSGDTHAKPIFSDVEDVRDLRARTVRILRRGVECVTVLRRIVIADRGALPNLIICRVLTI
jgi:hypothetical protein